MHLVGLYCIIIVQIEILQRNSTQSQFQTKYRTGGAIRYNM